MSTRFITTAVRRSLVSAAAGSAAIGAIGAAALGFAGNAAAAGNGSGGQSAADTVNSLQASGYNVQLNGTADVPLSECTVTDIHGLSGNPQAFTTVYVDISCPAFDS